MVAGNYRSGRFRQRDMLDDYAKLDVMELKRDGVFRTNSRNLQLSPHCPEVAFEYAYGLLTLFRASSDTLEGYQNPATQLVEVEFQPCRFGGMRPWFLCPCCGRRVSALYADSSHEFYCRTCRGLAYRSQFESWSGRRYLKANRLRWSLGGEAGAMSALNRPKGMHWGTFLDIIRKINALEVAALTKAAEQLFRRNISNW